MMNAIKVKLINWLTKNLIPTFNQDNVLRLDKFGGVYIKGENLSPETIKTSKQKLNILKVVSYGR